MWLWCRCLFGKAAILEYCDALNGGPTWDTIRDRDRIDMVWVKPDQFTVEHAGVTGQARACVIPR